MTVLQRTRLEEIMLGAALMGLVLSSMLYGINITQTHKYYTRFPNDRPIFKILVVTVCIIEFISVVLVTHSAWYYLVDGGSTDESVWSLNAEVALTMLIALIAESFLAYRFWILSGHRHSLAVIILALGLIHFASGEVTAVQFFLLKDFSKFGRARIPSIIRHTTAAVCDTLLAVSLCYFLHCQRTGYRRTNKIIDQLIIFFVTSGLITGLVQILCLITYLVVPKTWVYLALCFMSNRLYANTVICALNSRQILRAYGEADSTAVPPSRSTQPSSPSARSNFEKPSAKIDIYVVQEIMTEGAKSDLDITTDEDSPRRGSF